MPDLYDVLDRVVDERRPTRAELVEYCERRLKEPMTDVALQRMIVAMEQYDEAPHRR